MDNLTFLIAYVSALVVCMAITFWIAELLSPGFNVFFKGFTKDQETTSFFVKKVKLVLILAGFAGALNNGYTIKDANWLTLTWDMTDQLQATINNLWPLILTVGISLLVVHLVDKHWNK